MIWTVEYHEMKNHLQNRYNHHVRRNEELLKEAEKINDELKAKLNKMEIVSDRMVFSDDSNYASNVSRRDQLKSSARVHAQKATNFKFYVDHLPADNSFQLVSNALVNLEFISSV
jgi:hypothetical protein